MKTKAKIAADQEVDHPVTLHELSELQFDLTNPRYGPHPKKFKTEREVVDEIANEVGLEDLLSSMAVNGFFASEPLIGVRDPKKPGIKIHEGNRRLAAALILAGDSRAAGQKERRAFYEARRAAHGNQSLEPVPVMVFEGRNALRELLPHLGVKHIVGALVWDAYAKAHWVAKVIESGELSLEDVMQMIGDDQRLSERMLSSYYLIEQLVDAGRFDPSDSIKRGRGQAEFPFAVVYNAIDRPQIRDWIGMPESKRALQPKPIRGSLENAEYLLQFICGSRSKKIEPAIRDSRQISGLAKALSNPVHANALKKGKSLDQVEQEALPARERLINSLSTAQTALEDAIAVAGAGKLTPRDASDLLSVAQNVGSLAENTVDLIVKAVVGNGRRKR